MPRRDRILLASALSAAGLWLFSGFVNMAAGSSVYAGRVLRLIVPSPTNARFWTWPQPWSFLALLLGALAIAAVVLVLTIAVRGARARPPFASAWFAVVAAGAVTGLAIDAIGVLDTVAVTGWRGLTTTTIEAAVVGAYWGLVQGWIPALVASRLGPKVADEPAARTSILWPAVVAAVALLGFVVVGTLGADAFRLAIVQEQAALDTSPPQPGAAPDPQAPGSPPPAVALIAEERDPSWCTPEQATPLLGSEDAATGHRALSIRLLNFSDEPCVVEGYPDIVFADQNGNELGVAVEHGSSFMTQDAGSEPVEIPPGGYAITTIGWDANSTDGALLARTLFAAQVAGDQRGSWPVSLDVVAGSTVQVTAWELDELGPAVEGG